MSYRSTIIIPNTCQPNFMHAALHGLVENSFYRHRIIVMWSEPGEGVETATDFEIVAGERKKTFGSLRAFFDHHQGWLERNGVEVMNVTARAAAFRARFERGEIYKDRPYEGGSAVAWMNNLALSLVKTEWAIPNWDADFYPGRHWDRSIFDYASSLSKTAKQYLIPMHVQPAAMSLREAEAWDAWRDSGRISLHRMAIPTTRVVDGFAYVTDEEFAKFQQAWARPGETIREPCGRRERLHWVPWILRTDDFNRVGGFSYQGSGYDLDFDNRMGDAGFTKVGLCDSFIVHKGYVLPSCHVGAGGS